MSQTQSQDRLAVMEKKIDEMSTVVEKFGKQSASKVSMNNILAQAGPVDGSWPVEHLNRLAKSYDHAGALQMMKGEMGQTTRLIGWGSALQKMAGISHPSISIAPNYGQEQLEKEYELIPILRARDHGVPWLKGISGEVRKVALAEGSGVTGGYIIPPQWQNTLLTIAGESAFIEPKCQKLPMTTRTAFWPKLDITRTHAAGESPYFGGVVATWQPEAAQINETEPQFKMATWTAWDLVLYTVSSNQLLQDNGIGLDALLTQLFGAALTWYKEYAFLRGLGAANSMPLGVFNAPATYVQNRSSAGTVLLADLAAMMARLHVDSWDNAMWIGHQSILPKLVQMTALSSSSDWLVFLSPFSSPGGAATGKLPRVLLNGLPLFFTEKASLLGSKGDLSLMDWSKYVVAPRLEMQIEVSPHVLFRTNQLAWRVVCRLDGQPWLDNTIKDQNNYQISPFVCLN